MSDNKKAVNFLTDSLYDETPVESQTARSFFTSDLSFTCSLYISEIYGGCHFYTIVHLCHIASCKY